MRDFQSLFLGVFFPTSPLISLIFYYVKFETLCPVTQLKKSHFHGQTDKVACRVASLPLVLAVRPCSIIIIKLYFSSLIIFSENKISLIRLRIRDKDSIFKTSGYAPRGL